jgi:hypothetical protein
MVNFDRVIRAGFTGAFAYTGASFFTPLAPEIGLVGVVAGFLSPEIEGLTRRAIREGANVVSGIREKLSPDKRG